MNHIDIMKRLNNAGFKSYIVGGYIRDLILGKKSKDIDITTNARPEQIIEIFKDCNVKLVGQQFGVVLIDNIEVSTFRMDKYSGLSDKDVEITYSDTIEEDSLRRDIAFNSLYMDLDDNIYDFHNGIEDLKNREIRFIGNAKDRICEDPNRMIRACRFCSILQGSIVPINELEIYENRHLFNYISKERIYKEIISCMKKGRKSSIFFISLEKIGILEKIFPSLWNCRDISQNRFHRETIFDHCMNVGDNISCRFPLLKLAGYLHDIGKLQAKKWNDKTNDWQFLEHEDIALPILKKELEDLKFPNEEIDYIISIISLHMVGIFKLGKSAKKRLLRKLDNLHINYKDLIRFDIADKHGAINDKERIKISEIKQLLKEFKEILDYKEPFGLKDLQIDGYGVMTLLNIKPSKIVGEILEDCLNLVIEHPNLNNINDLVIYIKEKHNE
jgi:tRNA nucleotidyltransferase (CCA-adding enzyme)